MATRSLTLHLVLAAALVAALGCAAADVGRLPVESAAATILRVRRPAGASAARILRRSPPDDKPLVGLG